MIPGLATRTMIPDWKSQMNRRLLQQPQQHNSNRIHQRGMPVSVTCCLPWKVVVVLLFLFYFVLCIGMHVYWSQTLVESSSSSTSSSIMSIQSRLGKKQQQVLSPDGWNQSVLMEESMLKTIRTLESNNQTQWISCRRRSRRAFQSSLYYSIDPLAACHNKNQKGTGYYYYYYYYNPLSDRDRIVCGKSIPPNSGMEFTEFCPEPGRLFVTIPTPQGTGMPPIVTRFSHAAHIVPFRDCDIPCHVAGEFSIHTQRTIDGTPWRITMSMEGPQYYNSLYVQPLEWKNNHFWSTTSFQSEIPLPYYSRAEYKIWDAPGVPYATVIHGGVFMARNCGSRNNREKLIRELKELALKSQHFVVHSVSSCENNAPLPPGADGANKNSVMNKYLFYFAFENQCENDYITEKLWGPMEAGAVPVYYGAPNVHEFVPPNSIIDVNNFSNTVELFRYLEQVAQNKTLYESLHAWRRLPRPKFDEKLNLTYTHGTCRTCRWAYARIYGLGWNHAQQRVEDLLISRQTGLHPQTGLLLHPVLESWSQSDAVVQSASQSRSDNNLLHGTLAEAKVVLQTTLAKIFRTVRQVDGVIDLEIQNENGPTVPWTLKLQTKLQANNSVFSIVQSGQARLQDNQSRITFLTLPKTILATRNNENTISLAIDTFPVRIRIISENVDTFHKDAHQMENYFGSLMIRDFYEPVEVFYRH